MDSKSVQIGQEAAESIAISALGYLAGNMDRLDRFLALTGIHPQNIRESAKDAAFLVSVLDHLLSDESLLFAFAADSAIDASDVAAARKRLDRNSRQGWSPGEYGDP